MGTLNWLYLKQMNDEDNERKEKEMSVNKTVIVDIDGVLANNDHRAGLVKTKPIGKENWEEFCRRSAEDKPYPEMVDIILGLTFTENYSFVFLTGRQEKYRQLTQDWLNKHLINTAKNISCKVSFKLLMRPNDRPFVKDVEIKQALYKNLVLPFEPPVAMVFEDRDDCVAMWREQGLVCFQPRIAEY